MKTMEGDSTTAKYSEFFARYPTRIYNKGDVLIQAGDTPPAYFITEGLIVQYDISSAGDKLVVNMYKPGACISLASILNDGPSEFFFEAADYTTVYTASSRDVATFFRDNPGVTFDALKRVSRGSNGLMLRLARAMEGSAEGRILQELTIMQARFSNADGSVHISDTELATQTGMARETVSRSLKKLQSKGLITTQRGVITLN